MNVCGSVCDPSEEVGPYSNQPYTVPVAVIFPFNVAEVDVTPVASWVVAVRGAAAGASDVVNVLISPRDAEPSEDRYTSRRK